MQTKVIKSNQEKIREMTMIAIFIAIIAVLGLVPSGFSSSSLGFIKIAPDIEATIIHIPVLIGGTLLGRKMSIYLGLAFGVISLIAAFIYKSPMFVYPWVSVLPRILFGLVIYDVMSLFQRIFKNKYLAFGFGFFILTLIHTFMVLSLLWTSYTMVFGYASLSQAFLPYLAFLAFYLVPAVALIEAFLAGIVGSVVAVRLKGYLENRAEESAEN